MKKASNKQITKGENKGQTYTFPKHDITIKASSPEKAKKKLEALLDEKDN